MTLKKKILLVFFTLGWSHEEINCVKAFACLCWIQTGSYDFSSIHFIIASG